MLTYRHPIVRFLQKTRAWSRSAMSIAQPAGRMRPSLDFCCSKCILYTDNLSLFWQSWIWHFWCSWFSMPLYHVCYHCNEDSNAFSTL